MFILVNISYLPCNYEYKGTSGMFILVNINYLPCNYEYKGTSGMFILVTISVECLMFILIILVI